MGSIIFSLVKISGPSFRPQTYIFRGRKAYQTSNFGNMWHPNDQMMTTRHYMYECIHGDKNNPHEHSIIVNVKVIDEKLGFYDTRSNHVARWCMRDRLKTAIGTLASAVVSGKGQRKNPGRKSLHSVHHSTRNDPVRTSTRWTLIVKLSVYTRKNMV